MPVYEYQCTSCGNVFEATQRMSDPPLTTCTCGSEGTVNRLLSAGSGLIFKGSGFYITDYKNGKGSNASSSSSSTDSSPSSTEKSTSKTEPSSSSTPSSCGSGGCGCAN